MKIAIDFDGTCVKHDFPMIGEDIGAQEVLKELVKQGHELILLTMRSGETLKQAIEWFNKNNIKLTYINSNPEQTYWTTSQKVYANLYIDDCALGVPLLYDDKYGGFVDWEKVKVLLQNNGYIK